LIKPTFFDLEFHLLVDDKNFTVEETEKQTNLIIEKIQNTGRTSVMNQHAIAYREWLRKNHRPEIIFGIQKNLSELFSQESII
jgi:hypothetical protein